jgi:hypothetical protein
MTPILTELVFDIATHSTEILRLQYIVVAVPTQVSMDSFHQPAPVAALKLDARECGVLRSDDAEDPLSRHFEAWSFPYVSERIKREDYTDDSITKWGDAGWVNHEKQKSDGASSALDALRRSGEASDDYDSHSDSYDSLPVLIERYDCDSRADTSDSDSSVDIVPYTTSPLGYYRYTVGRGLDGADPPILEEDLYSRVQNEPAAALNVRLCPSRLRLRAMTAAIAVVPVRAVFHRKYRTPVLERTITDTVVDDLAVPLRLANKEYRCDN